jgi:hypothetical protein
MGLFIIPLGIAAFVGLAFLCFYLMDCGDYGPFLVVALILAVGGGLIYVFGWGALLFMAVAGAKPVCECVHIVCKYH